MAHHQRQLSLSQPIHQSGNAPKSPSRNSTTNLHHTPRGPRRHISCAGQTLRYHRPINPSGQSVGTNYDNQDWTAIADTDPTYKLTTIAGVNKIYLGCGTTRIYGSGDSHPSGYVSLAASSDTDGRMITSSPCCQFAGVATFFAAVS